MQRLSTNRLFGGHRFYMGKTGTAIAQLILSLTLFGLAITFVWWIVDAFLVHTWVKDKNRNLELHLLNQILGTQRAPQAGF
ncbi:TM2 domain-containing protein [Gorillibacterium sp. CAU 1737]|uniref:TM2 domain-containing protein n=1 Tax=Gorillibacterium sp. CAU 1737 TaxID=3140362 RepID=UPI0032600F00